MLLVIDLQLFTLTKERRHFFSKENCRIISLDLAAKREPNIIKESTLQLSSVIPLKRQPKMAVEVNKNLQESLAFGDGLQAKRCFPVILNNDSNLEIVLFQVNLAERFKANRSGFLWHFKV